MIRFYQQPQERIINNKSIVMDQFMDASEDKQNMTYQLMGIMGIDDIEIAYYALKEANWNLESVINDFLGGNPAPPPPPPPPFISQPSHEDDFSNEDYDENQFNEPTLQQKKQAFDEMFPSLGLSQQTSDGRYLKLKKISDKVDEQKLNKFINKLEENKQFANQLQKNNRAFKNNKSFIMFLNEHFNTKIRFSFGSFASNLAFSFLKKRPLLVYVHNSSKRADAVITALLQDQTITDFINKNFIVYGMFDNSNDYDIIAKELPITELPGVACYCYDEKKNSNVFLGAEKLIENNPQTIIQVLKTAIQKCRDLYQIQKQEEEKKEHKQNKKEQLKEDKKKPNYSIIDEQNEIYRQMEEEWKLKRQASKLNKQQKHNKQELIQKSKAQFLNEPQGQKVIQIIFRLPTGGSLKRRFENGDKVNILYTYVECFGSDKFENEYGEFDLIQTYPPLNLGDKKNLTILEVFPDSGHENLIVKEK